MNYLSKVLCFFLGHKPFLYDIICSPLSRKERGGLDIVNKQDLHVAKQSAGCKRGCGWYIEKAWICSGKEAEIYEVIKQPLMQMFEAIWS